MLTYLGIEIMDVLLSVGDIFEHMATQHKKMHIAYNRHD